MCKAIEDMRRQERQEAIEEAMREVALRMLEAGKYALEEISAMSGLPLDDIQNLQAEATA